MKYAIIRTGGKQYRVEKDAVIDIEKLNVERDAPFELGEVLFVHDGDKPQLGSPALSKYVVKAEFVAEILGPKVIAYKYKRRKNQKTKKGHRQRYSRVKITDIVAGTASEKSGV